MWNWQSIWMGWGRCCERVIPAHRMEETVPCNLRPFCNKILPNQKWLGEGGVEKKREDRRWEERWRREERRIMKQYKLQLKCLLERSIEDWKKKTNSRTPHIDIITVSFKPQEMKTKVNEKQVERMEKVWSESNKASNRKIKKSHKKTSKLF